MTEKTPKPLTTGVVARVAGVAPRTAARWCDEGLLRSYRIPLSRDRRVEVADLRRFLEDHLMDGAVARLEDYLRGRAS